MITADQLEYKRLQFEVAKQKESEDLWQFENRLHYLQKQAKIKEDLRFIEIYKKGKVPSNQLGPPRKKFTGSAQSIQQSEEDFYYRPAKTVV